MVDRLDRLGHHAVIGGDHQDRDIRGVCSTHTHGGKGLMARGIQEGNLLSVHIHHIGSNVLGNTACLPVGHMGVADRIQQGCLTVIDMTHHTDYRRSRHQALLGILILPKQFLNHIHLLFRLADAVVLQGNLLRLFVVDVVIYRYHDTLHKEFFDDIGSLHLQLVSQIPDRNLLRKRNGENLILIPGRLLGRRRFVFLLAAVLLQIYIPLLLLGSQNVPVMLLSAVIVALSALLAPDLFRRNRSGSLPVVLAEIAVSAGTGASLLIISGIGVNILPNCRTSRTAGKIPALSRTRLSGIPVIRRAGSPVIPVCIDILSPGRLLASLLRTTVGVDILPRLLQTAVCRACLKLSVFWLRLPRLLRTLGRYILPGRLLRALGLLLYRKPVAGPFSLLVREGTDQRTAHLLGADRSVSRPSGAVAARSRPPVSRTGIPALPLRAAGSGLPAVLGIKHRGNIRFLPGTLTPVSGSGTFLLPLSVRCGGSLLFRLRVSGLLLRLRLRVSGSGMLRRLRGCRLFSGSLLGRRFPLCRLLLSEFFRNHRGLRVIQPALAFHFHSVLREIPDNILRLYIQFFRKFIYSDLCHSISSIIQLFPQQAFFSLWLSQNSDP